MLRVIGVFLIVAGILAFLLDFILKQSGKFKWIGKLPGDILIQKGNFTFYFPLATCLLASLLISLFLFLIFKIFGKN